MLRLCHNTPTPRLMWCHNTPTQNTKAYVVSQHTDTKHQGLGCVTTHRHQTSKFKWCQNAPTPTKTLLLHAGMLSLIKLFKPTKTPRLGLCHNTLTPARTPRLGPCYSTLTPARTPRPGLCHNTLTLARTQRLGQFHNIHHQEHEDDITILCSA